jgi:hypothetical protein
MCATIRVMTREEFVTGWNALDRSKRKQLRRLVRLGRPIDDPELDRLAPGYAAYQRSRLWMRLFWIWFVPGVLLALSIASQVHPVLVGAVMAMAAQAVFTNRNLRRRATPIASV